MLFTLDSGTAIVNDIDEKLLNKLKSENPDERVEAIKEIKESRIHEAIFILIDLLDSKEWYIKILVIETLIELNKSINNKVGEAIEKLLLDRESVVRDDAVNALFELSYTPAIQQVQHLLCHDPDPVVRASAAETLSELAEVGDAEVLSVLETALNDRIEFVRAYSAYAIGYVGTPDSLSILDKYFISEESLDVRAEILAAKYRLSGDRKEFIGLINLSKDADSHLFGVILTILEHLIDNNSDLNFDPKNPQLFDLLVNTSQSFPLEKNRVSSILEKLSKFTV
ncbi:MAG: HEAT repeat domain-containing protein [Cyanobacteria bacterium P01_E01_bin.42]